MADASIRLAVEGGAVVTSAFDSVGKSMENTGASSLVMGEQLTNLQGRFSALADGMTETRRLLDITADSAAQTTRALTELKINPDALRIPDSAIRDLTTWQEKAAHAIGAGAAEGWDEAKTAFEEFKGYMESKVVIWGVALAIGVSAAVLGAVYAAYKGISFGVGLLTGESYKSENIDALVAMNKEVKALQEPLQMTAASASALNEALKTQGVSATDYTSTISAVINSTRTNGDELDRLGVKYKDQRGELLDTRQVMENAVGVLDTYTEGWDRNQAAIAIGMGTEKQLHEALAVTAEKVQTAKDRLIAYGLIIGPGTQEAVKNYEDSMRAFGRETDLTSQGFKRAIADNIMPVLTDMADFFREGFPFAVMAFRYSMATVTSLFYGLKTVVYMVAESVVGSISAIGSGLGGLASAAMKALAGDFTGAKAALIGGWEDAKTRLGGIGDNIIAQARRNSEAMKLAWGADSLNANSATAAVTKTGKAYKAAADDQNESAKSVQAASDAYGVLAAHIAKEMESATQSLEMQVQLTAADKFRIETLGKIDEAIRKGNITMDQAIQLESDMHDAEMTRANADLTLEKIKAAQALYAENLKLVDAYEKSVSAESDKNKALKLEIEMMGLSTKAQLELTQANAAAIIVTKQQELASIQAADAESGTMSRRQIALIEDIRLSQERNGLIGDKAALQQSMNNFKGMWESVDKTAHDVFVNIFQGGQNAFTKLRDTLKATLLDLLYQMTVKKWIFNITAAVTGTSAGVANAATGGVMDAANGASSLNTLYGAGSQLFTGATAGASTASLMSANAVGALGGDGLGALIAGNGGWAGVSATGSASGAASGVLAGMGPAGWAALAALAVVAVASQMKGDSRFGSQAGYTAAGGSKSYGGPNGSADNFGGVLAANEAAAVGIDKLLESLGSKDRVSAFGSGFESSEKGKGFSYAGGVLSNGKTFGQGQDGNGYNNNRGSMNAEEAAASYAQELKQSTLQALQAATDIPKSITDTLAGIDIDKLTGDALNKLNDTVTKQVTDLMALQSAISLLPFEQMHGLSLTALDGLAQLTGGIDALSGKLATYYDNYYSAEEKRANTVRNITDTLNAAGAQLSEADVAGASREAFRALVESTDAASPLYAALINVSQAFAGIVPAAANAASALVNAAAQMQAKLASVVGDYLNSSELRNFKAGEIQGTLAAGGVNLTREQILSASRNDARALYEQFAAQGNTAAQSAILDAAKAFADLTSAQGGGSGFDAGGGGGGGGGAAGEIKNEWRGIMDSFVDEIKRVRGELAGKGLGGVAYAQSQFAIATAQARAGDADVAKSLPALNRAYLELAEANAGSLLEVRRLQAAQIASLEATNASIAGKYGLQVPAFADGGVHTGGWAMVGEQGPELAYLPPARIYTASDTRALAGGGGQSNAELAEALRRMADRLDAIEENTRATALHTHKAARILERVTPGNNAVKVKVEA